MMLEYFYSEVAMNWDRVLKMTNWSSALHIGWWGWIITELEYSARFGVVVVTLKAMLLQTVGFSVLLGFIIYCYSSIYLMRNYQSTPQAVDIQSSLFYYFNIMLGSYDPKEVSGSWDSWAEPTTVSFIILTSIVMLNFLVAILTHIHERNQQALKSEHRKILLKSAQLAVATPRNQLIVCAIPPLSVLILPLTPLLFTRYGARISAITLKSLYCILFAPVLAVVFLGLSLLLVPITYISQLCRYYRKGNCAIWLVLGLPLLLKQAFIDLYLFLSHITTQPDISLLTRDTVRSDCTLPSLSQDSLQSDSNCSLLSTAEIPTLVDTDLIAKVMVYDRRCGSIHLPEAEMERRFTMQLRFLDVELVSKAILKAF
jgi:hypothetical protein